MVTETLVTKTRQAKNGSKTLADEIDGYRPTRDNWPRDYAEAYQRDPGPYTTYNACTIIAEEPLELFNGWLVWQAMTNVEERRVAGCIQEILSLAARACQFGQAYPDQFECVMVNKNLHKPDVCVLSNARYEAKVEPIGPRKQHLVLMGSPELVIEIRSPSNRRRKERAKRKAYFDSGAMVIWDVAHKQRKIWVYNVDNLEQGQEYSEKDEISCEQLFPGWKRKVADFFSKDLSAEEIVGEVASQWRAESRAEGRAEGREQGEIETLRKVLMRQASRRYGKDRIPSDLMGRLNQCDSGQLIDLADSIAISLNLEEWLASFPG